MVSNQKYMFIPIAVVVVGLDAAGGARGCLKQCQKFECTNRVFIKFMVQGAKPPITGEYCSQGVDAGRVVIVLIPVGVR